MARPGVTKSEVRDAILSLFSDGTSPSDAAIRQRLGNRGSNSTIAKHRIEVLHELSAIRSGEVPAGIPSELWAPVQDVWDLANSHARQSFEQEYAALAADREQLEVERQRLVDARQSAEQALLLAQQRAEGLELRLAEAAQREIDLTESLGAAQAKVSELTEEVRRTQTEAVHAQAEIKKSCDDSIVELNTRIQELQSALRSSQESLDRNDAFFNQRLEEARQANRALQEQFKEERVAHQEAMSQAEARLGDLQRTLDPPKVPAWRRKSRVRS